MKTNVMRSILAIILAAMLMATIAPVSGALAGPPEHSTYIPYTTWDSVCAGEVLEIVSEDSIARIVDRPGDNFHITYTLVVRGQSTGRTTRVNGGFNLNVVDGHGTLADRLIFAGISLSEAVWHLDIINGGYYVTFHHQVERCAGR